MRTTKGDLTVFFRGNGGTYFKYCPMIGVSSNKGGGC
jgi:hypothetical protein